MAHVSQQIREWVVAQLSGDYTVGVGETAGQPPKTLPGVRLFMGAETIGDTDQKRVQAREPTLSLTIDAASVKGSVYDAVDAERVKVENAIGAGTPPFPFTRLRQTGAEYELLGDNDPPVERCTLAYQAQVYTQEANSEVKV